MIYNIIPMVSITTPFCWYPSALRWSPPTLRSAGLHHHSVGFHQHSVLLVSIITPLVSTNTPFRWSPSPLRWSPSILQYYLRLLLSTFTNAFQSYAVSVPASGSVMTCICFFHPLRATAMPPRWTLRLKRVLCLVTEQSRHCVKHIKLLAL